MAAVGASLLLLVLGGALRFAAGASAAHTAGVVLLVLGLLAFVVSVLAHSLGAGRDSGL